VCKGVCVYFKEKVSQRGRRTIVEMVLIIATPAIRTEKKNPIAIFVRNVKNESE